MGIPLILHDVCIHKGLFVTNNPSGHEAIFSRSSNKDNMHWKRIHISMEEKWWNSEETDHATAADSGSDMNDELLRPQPDKDFTSDPAPVILILAILLLLGLPGIIIGGGGIASLYFSIMDPDSAESTLLVVSEPLATLLVVSEPLAIFMSLFGLLIIGILRMVLVKIMSVHRLRVKHSTDLLVFDSTYRGREHHFEERRLSEAVYLEYRETTHRSHDSEGNSTTSTWITAFVHGRSSEEEEWKLRISDLVERYQSKQEKALEIADAIGIELEVRIRR